MAHGWPKSIIEFRKVNASLADSTKHGGASKDAFHSVLPDFDGHPENIISEDQLLDNVMF